MGFKGKNDKVSKLKDSKEGYDLYSKHYEKDHFHLNTFEDGGFDIMYRDVKGKKILEIGAGTGRITGELKRFGAEVSACDISENMLKILNRKFPDVETKVCDIHELPYEDNSFDAVYAMFVVVHIEDLQTVFDEVHRVLKDGGVFVLSNINQRKAPKLKIDNGEEIIIKSQYHMPKNIISNLENSFFSIQDEYFMYNEKVWVTQLIKAKK